MWFRSKRIDEETWEERNNEVIQLSNDRNLNEALTAGHELFRVSKQSFGKHHRHTVTALNNLGIIYTLLKDFSEAESYLLTALQISEKVCGEISREVAAVNINLANLYSYKAKTIIEAVGAHHAES